MTGAFYTCLRRVSVAVLIQLALGQECYYPNGKVAPEKPCSSAKGSACCPDKWECLDNGLCHYPPDDLFGSYSCTDQSWDAPGCPSNLCTYDMNRIGGESITQCRDHGDQWCCNADAQNVNCCKESPEPRPFFALQDGRVYATVGSNQASDAPNLATITGLATSASGSRPSSTPPPPPPPPPPPSSSNQPQSSTRPPSSREESTNSPTPLTTLETQVTSGSTGIATIIVTQVITPSSPPNQSPAETSSPTSSEDSSNSNTSIIVGCAVGIPLSLALLVILLWLFRKHRRQQQQQRQQQQKDVPVSPHDPYTDPYNNINSPSTTTPPSPAPASAAKITKPRTSMNSTHKAEAEAERLAELSGQGIGPERPVSMISGRAELDSGGAFAPGHAPHAPHLVGVGGGSAASDTSSWGSAPPNYSPAAGAQSPWLSGPGYGPGYGYGYGYGQSRLDGGGGYVPYRPPLGHAAATGGGGGGTGGTVLQDVPEMAELSCVRTS